MRAARAAVSAVGAIQELKSAREKAKSKIHQRRTRNTAIRIKVISMGDAGVGKSCLIKRYCEEKFVQKYIGTIGVDYGVKCVRLGGVDVRVNLWDLAGGNEYFEVRNEFYKDAQGCMLVYDVNNRASFAALDAWIDESAKYGAGSAVVVVAGNKTDVGRRAVSENEGRAWAQANGFLFFEVSAAHGAWVKAMFAAIFQRVLETLPNVTEAVLSGAQQMVAAENAAAKADYDEASADVYEGGKTTSPAPLQSRSRSSALYNR
uniref:Uncharacterized protein n=1 Tax=Polyblepharides amylifera TaxID=1486889 RepID=A0A7R9SVU2_9CHLO|mmetsp:Transcript_347/g.463  ORF Transcript_347/g.463 Transcript_347/m.463 type:complete len:261 (+) Transcript_347:355-1137(+)|eukprot:CAMPEP_0196572640 /NCGR_PEP_ID=MMETSP1081-20130531/2643_1 /TAXON_ID=36882 /ORGANISM="Pyramimonas amylifera, Strain CCMP720" /LENGTH=260 /DNA_ID=CAMNT_0041890019 /DNA_START=355 /DNA_END=1137 /DNA_ORIENTATION=-